MKSHTHMYTHTTFIKYNEVKSELTLKIVIISSFWQILCIHDRPRNEMSKFACFMATLFRTQRRSKRKKEKEMNERKRSDLLLVAGGETRRIIFRAG